MTSDEALNSDVDVSLNVDYFGAVQPGISSMDKQWGSSQKIKVGIVGNIGTNNLQSESNNHPCEVTSSGNRSSDLWFGNAII